MMDEDDKKYFEIERALKGKRKGGLIEDWRIQGDEDGDFVLWGYMEDDDYHRSGTMFHTSKVIKLHRDIGLVETKNTYYRLGKEYVPVVRTEEEQKAHDEEQKEALELMLKFI